jgi:hypothetical protein
MAWLRRYLAALSVRREAVLEPGGYLFLATGQFQPEQRGR